MGNLTETTQVERVARNTETTGDVKRNDGRVVHPQRILAVSSGGGHWVQLLRVAPAFEGHEVAYVTVSESYRPQVGASRFYRVNDATRWNKLALVRQGIALLRIIWRERPDTIVTTGAAPGYLAIRIGRLLGIRTVWIDSIANAEKLSLSGQRIGKHADLWLTQWPHLESAEGPWYAGAVL